MWQVEQEPAPGALPVASSSVDDQFPFVFAEAQFPHLLVGKHVLVQGAASRFLLKMLALDKSFTFFHLFRSRERPRPGFWQSS